MLYYIYNSFFFILVYKCNYRERCFVEVEMRLKLEYMLLECGEIDYIVSNLF